jgi:virginiamycin B lyase
MKSDRPPREFVIELIGSGSIVRGEIMRFFTGTKIFALLIATVFLSLQAFGATVTGTVKGPDGAPLMGAFVEAQNTNTKITVNVLSSKDGRYHVDDLPAGTYDLRVRAIGYRVDPHPGVTLTAKQSVSYDWALQKGPVRWNDLSLYQGEKLLPNLPGKEMMFGPGTGNRDATCQVCHGFQTRMASVRLDADGWKSRIDYMRQAMAFSGPGRLTDEQAERWVSYVTQIFGPNSILPASAADAPGYKDVVKTFSPDAMNMVYVEYDLAGPNRMPWSAVPDKAGNIWMPNYGRANTIARLDPETGKIQEFKVPTDETAAIHSVFPAPDGSVWMTEFSRSRLARWDPKTEMITEYPDPAPLANGRLPSHHTVRIGPDGMAWSSGQPVSRFDPKTGKYDYFSEGSYGVMVDKDGNCWFTEYGKDGKIGRIDGKTLKVQTWTPPPSTNNDNGQIYSRRLQFDADGNVWFDESEGNNIAKFDPKTETFKVYPLPGPKATPYAMNLDNNHNAWYSSEYTDVVGRLDTTTGKVTEYPFPHSEITSREYFLDSQGRMWYASPSNNKVGYFYLAK